MLSLINLTRNVHTTHRDQRQFVQSQVQVRSTVITHVRKTYLVFFCGSNQFLLTHVTPPPPPPPCYCPRPMWPTPPPPRYRSQVPCDCPPPPTHTHTRYRSPVPCDRSAPHTHVTAPPSQATAHIWPPPPYVTAPPPPKMWPSPHHFTSTHPMWPPFHHMLPLPTPCDLYHPTCYAPTPCDLYPHRHPTHVTVIIIITIINYDLSPEVQSVEKSGTICIRHPPPPNTHTHTHTHARTRAQAAKQLTENKGLLTHNTRLFDSLDWKLRKTATTKRKQINQNKSPTAVSLQVVRHVTESAAPNTMQQETPTAWDLIPIMRVEVFRDQQNFLPHWPVAVTEFTDSGQFMSAALPRKGTGPKQRVRFRRSCGVSRRWKVTPFDEMITALNWVTLSLPLKVALTHRQ